jgi:hypothetical protein
LLIEWDSTGRILLSCLLVLVIRILSTPSCAIAKKEASARSCDQVPPGKKAVGFVKNRFRCATTHRIVFGYHIFCSQRKIIKVLLMTNIERVVLSSEGIDIQRSQEMIC